MKAKSICLLLLLALFCSTISSAQWVQVNNGLIDTTLHVNDSVIVSLGTDCVNARSGPSVTDSSYGCVPAGTAGTIIGGPTSDENKSSSLIFWHVIYSVGIEGWSDGEYLHKTNLVIPDVYSFAVSGTNLFAGTDGEFGPGGVFLSTNNGATWTSAGLPHITVRALAVSGMNLFAGTFDGGVFLTTNNGTNWTSVSSGLTNLHVRSLAVSRTCLFVNTDGGTFRSTNNGTIWEPITWGSFAAIIDTNLFTENYNGDISLSTDNGTSWTKINSGYTLEESWDFCASGKYLFNINEGVDPDICVGRMIWTDSSLVSAGGMNFPSGFVGTCGGGAKDIAAVGTNVFLTVAGVGNFFSTNSGADWEVVTWPLGTSTFSVLGTNLFAGGIGVWRNSLSNALPIQIASFKATALNSTGVALTWTTVSETNNYGFYVQRNGVDIAFIAGHGTTLQQHTYSYTDKPSPGQYQYRLRQVDLNGTVMFSESVTIVVSAPQKFTLKQNYPNPFNPSTRISFSITKEGPVTLRVYDILGREVATLVNENRKSGEYTEQFDGSQMASGMYVCILKSSEGRLTSRMILVK